MRRAQRHRQPRLHLHCSFHRLALCKRRIWVVRREARGSRRCCPQPLWRRRRGSRGHLMKMRGRKRSWLPAKIMTASRRSSCNGPSLGASARALHLRLQLHSRGGPSARPLSQRRTAPLPPRYGSRSGCGLGVEGRPCGSLAPCEAALISAPSPALSNERPLHSSPGEVRFPLPTLLAIFYPHEACVWRETRRLLATPQKRSRALIAHFSLQRGLRQRRGRAVRCVQIRENETDRRLVTGRPV